MNSNPATESKMSEADFLRLQAEEAKRGVGTALNQAKAAIAGKVDPRQITRRHPIVAIMTAAIGGFAAALLAIPSKEEQELRRLERLHRATHPAPPPSQSTNGKSENHPPAEKPSIGATLLHEAIAMIKPILLAAITAGIKSATAAPPPAQTPDGRTPPNPPS
jgi:hypothetical protein